MKKIAFIFIITAFAGSLWAGTLQESLRSLYDVVAPVISGNPAAADRQVGQIFYDNQAGAFKGVNKDGGIDRLTNVNTASATAAKATYLGGVVNVSFNPLTQYAIVAYTSQQYDTTSAYNTSTGQFLVTADGYYHVSAVLNLSGIFNVGDVYIFGILVDGENIRESQVKVTSATDRLTLMISGDVFVPAGFTFSVGVKTDGTNPTINDAPGVTNSLSIHQIL